MTLHGRAAGRWLARHRTTGAALAGQLVTVTYALCGMHTTWPYLVLAVAGTILVHVVPDDQAAAARDDQ